MQYDLIIGIDPAGIGNNGMVIYSSETNNIDNGDFPKNCVF
ncbi:hypothetical protein [Spiroplasma endosymbiont of Aleiodes alternator]